MNLTSNFSDSHLHLDGSRALYDQLRTEEILAIINCQSPQEWQENAAWAGDYPLHYLSFGIHPWEADLYVEDLSTYYEACDVIGEIGLCKAWTDLPLDIQEGRFVQQLKIAQDLKKTVILHSKGYEKEVFDQIQKFPNRYYVHWYSQARGQKDFIDLGAYMSIGPDVYTNPAVRTLARQLPADQILIETDGLGAVAWAKGLAEDSYDESDYAPLLLNLYQEVAKIRQVKLSDLVDQCQENLLNFVHGSSASYEKTR